MSARIFFVAALVVAGYWSLRFAYADALFRAVALEPGQHVVEFRFEPLSHVLGALISALTLALAIGLIVWGQSGRK